MKRVLLIEENVEEGFFVKNIKTKMLMEYMLDVCLVLYRQGIEFGVEKEEIGNLISSFKVFSLGSM